MREVALQIAIISSSYPEEEIISEEFNRKTAWYTLFEIIRVWTKVGSKDFDNPLKMTEMDKKLEPETTQTPERPRRFCDEWGVLRVPVTGTPWAVVWTNDSRAFFHNAVTKESVWEVPAALADDPEVAKMIESSKMRKLPVRDPGGLYLQLAAKPEVVEAEYRIVFARFGQFSLRKGCHSIHFGIF